MHDVYFVEGWVTGCIGYWDVLGMSAYLPDWLYKYSVRLWSLGISAWAEVKIVTKLDVRGDGPPQSSLELVHFKNWSVDFLRLKSWDTQHTLDKNNCHHASIPFRFRLIPLSCRRPGPRIFLQLISCAFRFQHSTWQWPIISNHSNLCAGPSLPELYRACGRRCADWDIALKHGGQGWKTISLSCRDLSEARSFPGIPSSKNNNQVLRGCVISWWLKPTIGLAGCNLIRHGVYMGVSLPCAFYCKYYVKSKYINSTAKQYFIQLQ